MIKDVPTAINFAEHGLMFLNLAWDTVFDLHSDLEELQQYWEDAIGEDYSDSYWKSAKRPLSIAHALSQQGAELILKAKIAEVSPFLLFSGSPSDWPRGNLDVGISFADFRTIDAQDLIRGCNIVCNSSLPEQFVTMFEKFRKIRNSLFHTVDVRLQFSFKDIVRYILVVAQLIRPGHWPAIRRAHLLEMPKYAGDGVDWVGNQLCSEMDRMINLLEKTDLINIFNFDKKRQRYICTKCYDELNRDGDPAYPKTAQLNPNRPDSKHLYCFVCGGKTKVLRISCEQKKCKGNVISAGDYQCLTCGEYQENAE